MFTGIIEKLGEITGLTPEGTNLHIDVRSAIAGELKVDQSVAHNGICLTVIRVDQDQYRVTAIAETLSKTNIKHWKIGDRINLERAMVSGGRLDGHMVQGHVDQTATCRKIIENDGSWSFAFQFDKKPEFLLIPKGSVCIDGVSLTVVDVSNDTFTVAIIPYTFDHTSFGHYQPETVVNIEFDVIGKYVHTYLQHYRNS